MVEAAPFVLSTVLALSIGLGRVRIPPRALLVADCVLRAAAFAWLGLLALANRLTLASVSPGVALICDVAGALVLLAIVVAAVPRVVTTHSAVDRPPSHESGWRILRRRPVTARLLFVVFFFNFLYLPVEIALPL